MLSLLLAATLGHAAETGPVDVGALKASEIKVVQKSLYGMDDRTEMGAHLGRARHSVIEGAGHAVHLERPGDLAMLADA